MRIKRGKLDRGEAMDFRIKPTIPYDFDLTVGIYSKFKGEIVDNYTDGVYRRLLNIDDTYFLISVKSTGTIDDPELLVSVHPESIAIMENQVRSKVEHMLSTNLDLQSFYSAITRDNVLSKVKDKLYGLRPPRTASFYEALIIAIIEQQIALPIAILNKGRIVRRYGKQMTFHGKKHYAFPSPDALANAKVHDLRNLKLSQNKAEYITNFSQKVMTGELNLDEIGELSNEEIIDILTKIRGIGRWTAEYAIVRGLGRLAALPANDAALKKIVSALYCDGKGVSEEEVRVLLDQWREFKGYVAFYLLNMGRLK